MVKIGGFNWVSQKAITPTNIGSVNIAQNVIENTVARANARLENALQADGIQCLIWVRSLGGNACSCTGSKLESSAQKGLNKTPYYESEDGYSIVPVRGYVDGYTANMFDENQKMTPDPFGEGINSVNGFEQLNLSPDELALLNMEHTGLFGTDSSPCAICYGTGRTQGYSLFNGQRVVLAANNDYQYQLSDGTGLDTEAKPTAFTLPSNKLSAVIWNVELPTYYYAVSSINVFNNRQLANNTVAEYSADNGATWNPLTTTNLMAAQGQAKKWLVRVRSLSSGDFDTLFTHVVINFEGMDRCKGQTPNMEVSINMETIDAPVTQTWIFGASIPALPRESIFYDSKYGYLWKVLGVEQSKTANGQIFGYSVSARIVQLNEKYYSLKTSLLQTTDQAFYGLAAFQGGSNIYDNNQINRLNDQVKSFNWNNQAFAQGFAGYS